MNTSSTERSAGLALICAGVLNVVTNSVLTPLLPRGVSFAHTVASPAFAWRESVAAVGAVLLLFGTVGLYLRLSERVGKPGAVAFGLAFCGSALLLGVEWSQLFDIRDFARRAPDALDALNAKHGLSLSDIGALIVLGIFTIGWLGLAGVAIWARSVSRMAASLVIAGFFLIPMLQLLLPGLLGAIVGNVVLGVGWTWLGVELWRGRVATHQPLRGLSQ
jgi:hypothetical protein